MQGRPEDRLTDVWRRCKAMLVYGLGQQKTLREWPGVLHFCMYVGFVVLFIGTLMVAVHEDLGIEFLHGPFYLLFSLTLDLFGLLCLIGVAGLTWRRYVIRPSGLDNRREDLIVLVWFIAVLLSGFVVEGARIGGTELQQHPGWAVWSPVGALVALVFAVLGVSESLFLFWHRVWWWTHMVITFGFLTYIGFSKLSHLIFSPANLFLHKFRANGELAPIANLDKALEGDEEAMASVRFGGCQPGRFHLEATPRPGRLHPLRALPGQLPGVAERQAVVAEIRHPGPAAAHERHGCCCAARRRTRRCGDDRRRHLGGRAVVLHHLPRLRGELSGWH